MTRLSEFESQAKTAGRGKWNKEKNPNVSVSVCVCWHLFVYWLNIPAIRLVVKSYWCISNNYIFPKAVRNIIWNVDNLRNFVDKNHGKELDGNLHF